MYEPPPPPPVAECCSSVLFLPGFEGSRLKVGDNILWPVDLLQVGTNEDLEALKLDDAGNSITSGITVDGILRDFHTVPIYSGFADFMDTLVVDGTIRGWEPFAYDWRFPPQRILAEGVQTDAGTVSLVDRIIQLAAQSHTGQVTVVGHSNGGLLGKALIKALEETGKTHLIDSFVMVGTPQIGTAQAVGGVLHGERSNIGWGYSFVSKAEARALGQNMESAYNLLPSREYFTHVTDPTVVFDENASYTDLWRRDWGQAIGNYTELFQFLTDAFDTRNEPSPSDTRSPTTASSTILTRADAFHQEFDSYDIPDSIRTVQVAGWGLSTIKGINYKEFPGTGVQYYVPLTTVEGDFTVLYPSALSSEGEKYYLSLDLFNESVKKNFEHKNMMNATPTQTLLSQVIKENADIAVDFIAITKPDPSPINRLLVAVHSPLTLGARDSQNRFTGLDSSNQPNQGIELVKNDIPNSVYFTYGESKYLILPQGETYTFTLDATDTGTATVVIESLSEEAAATTAVYSNVPVSESTSVSFSLSEENTPPTLLLDEDSDGTPDATIAPDSDVLSIADLLAVLKETIVNLDISQKLKNKLLKKIDTLEKKIEKKKAKNAKILTKLEESITKQSTKGRISEADASEILILLDELEAQSDVLMLDPATLHLLKEKVGALDLKQNQKDTLLKRIERLEKKESLMRALTNFSQALIHKGQKDKIPESDVQVLVTLLEQIEATL